MCRDGKRVVFVKGVLPGETITAEISEEHPNYAIATLTGIITPSHERIKNNCPFGYSNDNGMDKPTSYCPGCCYRHCSYEKEVLIKNIHLSDLLERLARIANPPLLPPVPSPLQDAYRNKLTLHAWQDEVTTKLGYFSEDNTTVIDIPSCLLAQKPISERLAQLRSDPKFVPSLQKHVKLTIRHTSSGNTVHWVSPDSPSEDLIETSAIGDLTVSANGFFQINPAVHKLIIERVRSIIKELKPDAFVDVFCGVGVFALLAAMESVSKISAIESAKDAVRAAKLNAERLNKPHIRFTVAPSAVALKHILNRYNACKTMVLLDPPRRGLDKKTIHALLNNQPEWIIYVSCAADTAARDIRALSQSYKLINAQLFDMFPRTAWFESIFLLTSVK